MLGQTTLLTYTFDGDGLTGATNVTSQTGVNPTFTGTGASVQFFGGNPGSAASMNAATSRYFDLVLTTTGYSNLNISFDGRASSTGSVWTLTGDSTGGTTLASTGVSLTMGNSTYTSRSSTAIGNTYSNKASIRLRFSTGNSNTVRIDNIVITGTLQATSVTSGTPTSTSIPTISCTNGTGTSRAVFIANASSGAAAPVNGTTYTANTVFGSGTQIGSTGWYCVFNNTGTPSVTVTGLSGNTTYRIMVCEYTGTGATSVYNTYASGTNNPLNIATAATPTSTLAAYGTQLSGNITKGTSNVPLAGFTISPSASADFTSVTVTGASLTSASDVTNVRIYRDFNGDGIINTTGGTDAVVNTGSSISFPSGSTQAFTISGETGFSSARSYIVVADISASSSSSSVGVSIGSGAFVTSLGTNSGSMATVTRSLINSASSDIIRSSGFTEPTNLAYGSYQSANITTSGAGTNNIKIAEFTLRDGSGSSDIDGLATSLTSISFTVGNFANIRRLAIYDNTSTAFVGEVAVSAAATTIALSPSIIAADNGNRTFSVYASFNTIVTDNQQIQLTVTSTATTASSAGSGFAATNAGGAASDILGSSNTANKLIVTASGLFYTTEPPSTVSANNNLSTTPVVTAKDGANGSIDVDFAYPSYAISNSSSLTQSNTTTGGTTSNGVFTFPASFQFTSVGGPTTLTLTSGLLSANSAAGITVTVAPVITATPTSLAAFSTNAGTASTAQAFTVTGTNLSANISVTAPTGFEVSQTVGGGSGYAATQALTQASGAVSKVVYVRMTSAATGTPSGNVALTSTSASTVNVAVSGTVNAAGSSLIAGWDFTTTTTGGTATASTPSTPTTFTANFGTGVLYLNGTNGSSTWSQASELDAFAGTGDNALSGWSTSTSTGTSLSLLAGTSPGFAGNGKRIVFKIDMTGFKDLIVSYSTRYSGTTAFTSQAWEYSTNGSSWTSIQTITVSSSTFGTKTLNTITGLDNAANAYVRLTVSGASATSNNRLDNVQLNATANPSPAIIVGGGPLASLSTTFGTESSPTSFTLAGSNLSTTISIAALSGFEFNNPSVNSTYTSTLSSISATGPTTINVRLTNSAVVGSYSGNIVCTSGSTTLNVPMAASTVSKATPTLSISNSPVTYNGSQQSATVSGTGSGTVSNITYTGNGGTTYSESSTAPTNAGTYAVTADIDASSNYNAATAASAGTFTISKASSSITAAPTATGIVLGQALSASTLSGGTATPVGGSFAFTSPSTIPGSTGSYSASVTYTPSDVDNYNTTTTSVNVSVVQSVSTFSNTQFTTARNITRGTTELPIYRFQVDVTNSAATLSSLGFTTPATIVGGASDYVNTDITNFKAFLTTSTTFSNLTQLGSTSASGKTQQNAGETLIDFTSLATTLNAGTTYYIWLTADVLNGAVAGRTIKVNAPTVGITGSVTGTNSATGTQTIEAVATNYYLNVGGSVTTAANYFTSPNGVGTTLSAAGLTHTSNDVNLNIPITVTNASDFTLGNGSKIIVQNGGSLTVGSLNTITGTIDVNDGGTLNINNTSILHTLGTLGSTSSSVIYSASGAQAIATKNYANLTISGGNTKTLAGAAAVSGTLTINSTILALGSNNISASNLTLDGLGTRSGTWGSTASATTYKNNTYFSGTGIVTVTNNTALTPSINGVNASQSITYGAASITLTGTVSATGPVYPANGETVSVTINGNTQTTTTTGGNGSFSINFTTSTIPVSASTYTITYAYVGSGFLNAASNNTSTALTVNAATNNWTGGTGNWSTAGNWSLGRVPSSLNDNITISSGTPTLDVNYTLGTGRTLTLSGSAALVINPSSSITIAGTVDFGGKSVTVQSDNTGTGSIGTISGTLSNASNVTVQRYAVGSGRNWRFLSSPVSGVDISNWMTQFYVTGPCTLAPTGGLGSINDQGWHTSQANIDYPGVYNVSTNNRAVRTTSIRQYVEANSTSGTASGLNAGWADVTTSTALTAGKGFRAFIRGPIGTTGQLNGTVTSQTAVTVNLTGTLNQGAINAPTITYSGSGRGWNLIGNPYACAYDWTNNATVKTQIVNNTIHVFNPSSNGYISYNPSSGGSLSNGIIPSGAAFFVQATGSGQAAVTFNEAAKVTGVAPTVVHKGAKSNEFSIKYSKDSTENDVFIAMIIDNATLNNDGYDIIKIRNENLNLSSYGEDTMQLTLSAIPPVVAETRIKLNVEATAIGTYNFDFKNMDNFQSNITVSLFDRYTNKTTDVRKNTKYTFDMGPGVNQWGNNRFELILNLDKTNVDEFALLNQTQMLVYPNPATDVLNINISNSSFKNSEVVVYNISSAEVLKTNMANTSAQLNIETLSNGVYFVKVSNQNGFNKTVKFIK